jgi:hypothetical protein
MFKRLKYLSGFTHHFILYKLYKYRLRFFSLKWFLQNKNIAKKMQEIRENYPSSVHFIEFENNKYLELHEMIGRYSSGILKQNRIIGDIKYKNNLRVMQKKDNLTLSIRKIRNLLQSKYRYMKYENFRKRNYYISIKKLIYFISSL